MNRICVRLLFVSQPANDRFARNDDEIL